MSGTSSIKKALNKSIFSVIAMLVTVFTVSALFGANITMARDHNGAMVNCPLMSQQSSLCQMDAVDHLAQWLQIFSALPVITVLMLLLILAAFVVTSWIAFADPPPRAAPYPYFISRDPQYRVFNFLVSVFASGILHPKTDA